MAAWWRSEAGKAAWLEPLWLVVEKVVKKFLKSCKVLSSRRCRGLQSLLWPPGGALRRARPPV